MSNSTESNNPDRDINILKSTINNLTQENKQLLESNKQLKIEDRKLRDLINTAAHELETQIQLILGWSKLLSGDYDHQQFPYFHNEKEDRELMLPAIYRAALKLKHLTEDMKLEYQSHIHDA